MQWEGTDASGDTWEPLKHLTNCEQAIRDFELAQGVVVPRPLPPPASQAKHEFTRFLCYRKTQEIQPSRINKSSHELCSFNTGMV